MKWFQIIARLTDYTQRKSVDEATRNTTEDLLPDGKAWCYEGDNVPHECNCDWIEIDGEWFNLTTAEREMK